MASHRHLKAWQHARTLAVACTAAARGLPPEERFGLADQLRRASFGAALNIAEGSGRQGARDFRRFLISARASLDEVEAILELARDVGYLAPGDFDALEARRDEAARTLFGLIRALDRGLLPRHDAS